MISKKPWVKPSIIEADIKEMTKQGWGPGGRPLNDPNWPS